MAEDDEATRFDASTGANHWFQLPDRPRVTIPIDWVSHQCLLDDLEENSIAELQMASFFEVTVDGEPVSYGLECVSRTKLEISFRVEKGEHDIVIRRVEDGEGPVIFAQRIRLGRSRIRKVG